MSALTAYLKSQVNEINVTRLEAAVEAAARDNPSLDLDTFRGLVELWRGEEFKAPPPDLLDEVDDAISECHSAQFAADEAASKLERLARKMRGEKR